MGAPATSDVSARVGEEATEAGFCGDKVTDGEGLLGVWDTADGNFFVQVLGMNVVIFRRRLAGSGTEPTTGAGKSCHNS